MSRNVHAATQVDTEQRRNLCEFVLGRRAVANVDRLAQIDIESRSTVSAIKSVERELSLAIKAPDNLDTFLALNHEPDIVTRIEDVRLELKHARAKDVILARQVPVAVALPSIDRSLAHRMLGMSADFNEGLQRIVEGHVTRRLDSEGIAWLAIGARQLRSDSKCPFCDQDVSMAPFIASVKSFFSEEYVAYADALAAATAKVRAGLGAATFSETKAAFATQLTAAAAWTEPVTGDASPSSLLAEAEREWKLGAQKLGEVVKRKQAKPFAAIDAALADGALSHHDKSVELLARVNEAIKQSSISAEDQRSALSIADTDEIEKRLNRLENQKRRFEPAVTELLGRRSALLEQKATLDNEKDQLKKAILEEASKVVGKYQLGINYYLEYLSCDIRIESAKAQFPAGKASVQYVLKAHGHEIGLGSSLVDPCFDTVLSDGDKYTFALSFFFARLKGLASLEGRTVVLDDPVSSLGSSRRSLIQTVIRDLRTRHAQVVVLTHDERMAAMIWRDRKLKRIVALQVDRIKGTSALRPWDVERATRSEYVRHFETLCVFLESGGDHRNAAASIRPYLEQRLRHLFPGPPFETRDSLGEMISRIRDSKPGSRVHVLRAKVQELEALNDASLPSHHATDDVLGMPQLTASAVRAFAQKALDVVG